MLNQTDIQQKFNKAASSYDTCAIVQQQAAEFLVDKLLAKQIKKPKKILDLGTGTGYLPKLLFPQFPQASYLLNDLAENMLDICRHHFNNQENFAFLTGDMEQLQINQCDLIVSNFALQWVDNLWQTLEKFHAKADTFAFSVLVKGTFDEWEKIINLGDDGCFNHYPTAEELVDYCNQIKGDSEFDFWQEDIKITSANPLAFMRYLQKLGASGARTEASLKHLKSILKGPQQEFTTSYKIFFGIFRR